MHHSARQSTTSYTFHNLLEEYCQPETQGSSTCLWGIFHMKTTEVDCLRSFHMVSTLFLTTMPTSTCLVLQFLHKQLTLLMYIIECMPPLSISFSGGKAIGWPALVMHQDEGTRNSQRTKGKREWNQNRHLHHQVSWGMLNSFTTTPHTISLTSSFLSRLDIRQTRCLVYLLLFNDFKDT